MVEITAHKGLFKNTDLHVEDTGGSGRPVVLIHGWPLSGESWKEQIEPLKDAGFRVITYDRRGFGRSDKPPTGYDYDTFTEDLFKVIEGLELVDVTLVGFSMGGGEVARYMSKYGAGRIRSVVFAGAVTPYLKKSLDNPEGPLTTSQAGEFATRLTADEDEFYEFFTTQFYSVDGKLKVKEEVRKEALNLAKQADKKAALKAMQSWGTTDFRDDLKAVSVPTLVIHGEGDALVDYQGSGARTHRAIPQSELHVIEGGPHGINVSDAKEFNRVLIDFLKKPDTGAGTDR